MFEDLAYFARVGGLLYLFAMFIGVLIYAFWPNNKKTFDRAARIPLERDELQ